MSSAYTIPTHVMKALKDMGYTDTFSEMSGSIAKWRDYYEASGDFWNKIGTDGKRTYKIKRRSIKPAKRVCREWASLMLNEDTQINCENKICNDWLSDYFKRIKFWSKGQELIERSFALGTGAWAVWLDTTSQQLLVRRYYANMIVVLSWDDDRVKEIAFCTRVTLAGKEYDQLQVHQLQGDGYHIITKIFNDKGKEIALEGVIDDFPTGSSDPWFAVVTPSLSNTVVEFSPYGVSVYADAIDVLEAVDIAFDAFINEPQAGKMRVFMSDMMFEVKGSGGDKKQVIPFGEDDATFFRMIADNNGELIKEFAPALRTAALLQTYRASLQTMGDACGFGLNYFDVDDSGGIKTATEVSSDNSQLMRNIRKHENLVGDAIMQISKAVLQAARKLSTSYTFADENGTVTSSLLPDEGAITVTFDDSIIQDTQSEKQQDLAEVGVTMNAWEYRVKWYGEDEETAKANVPGTPQMYEEPAGE